MIVHLPVHMSFILLWLQCSGPKIDRPERAIASVPINACCSIFNDILPIRD